MNTVELVFFIVGLVAGLVAGYAAANADTVTMVELRKNGYDVVHHEERHGEFHTNWIEVIRK